MSRSLDEPDPFDYQDPDEIEFHATESDLPPEIRNIRTLRDIDVLANLGGLPNLQATLEVEPRQPSTSGRRSRPVRINVDNMGDQEGFPNIPDQSSPVSPPTSPPGVVPLSPNSVQTQLASDPLNANSFMSMFQHIMPNMEEHMHKGSAGRIGIIGGSRFYAGAPYFAGFGTLRLGGDLSYIITTKSAAPAIKSYSPELIVCPVLDSHDAMAEISQILPKIHSLVIGPGLGKDGEVYKNVIRTVELAKEQKMPLVFDADAMILLTRFPELVRGYKRCIITPNAKEFDYLASKLGLQPLPINPNESSIREAVRGLASKLDGITVLRKGPVDIMSDGALVATCSMQGSPRRCGGQGDIIAGACGLYSHWTTYALAKQRPSISCVSPFMFASFAACAITRTTAMVTFRQLNRSMLTTDMIANLPSVYKTLNFIN